MTEESARLRRVLEKLAAPPGVRRQVLAGVSPAERLSGLVDEIDETVLPRTIELTLASGSALRIEAGNRRLLKLADPVPPELATQAASLPPEGFSYAGAADLSSLTALMLAALSGVEDVGLRRRPLGRVVPPDEAGVSAATLRQAWASIEEQDAGAGARQKPEPLKQHAGISPVEALLRHPGVTAWLRFGANALPQRGGDAALCDRLASLPEADSFGEADVETGEEEPVLLAIGPGPDEAYGAAMVMAQDGADGCLAAVAPRSLAQIATAWASALRR